MPTGLMLDPSVFLAERTLGIAIREIESAQVPVVVPGHFLALAQDASLFDRVGEFFGAEDEAGGERGSSRAAGLFRDWMPQSAELLVPYEPSAVALAEALPQDFAARLEGQELNDDIKQILFEEWVYLQTQSWIGSRLRAASERFKDARADVFDLAVEAFDSVVERAGDEVPQLLRRENIRPATKWVIATSLPFAARAAVELHLPGGYEAADFIIERLFGAGVGAIGRKALARFDP